MEVAPKLQTMAEPVKPGTRKDCSAVREVSHFPGEETPAYRVLKAEGLLTSHFRLETSSQIDQVPPNATRFGNLWREIVCCPCRRVGIFQTFEVDNGKVRLVEDGRGGYSLYGAGVHRICDPFHKVGGAVSFSSGIISHGDITLATIDQGQIGFVFEKGQPILLPPGMHQWRSTTMVYVKSYDLNNKIVRMGPLTLVTVDSGYSAITEDNGMQKVLPGGSTYLLTHRNWKFQKYMSEKIQTSNLQRIEATSADNVLMAVDATVIWRITDVQSAALNAGETISKDGGDTHAGDMGSIAKLLNDVLKQAEASLAAFIGAVNYSDTFNVAAAVQSDDVGRTSSSASVARQGGGQKEKSSSPLFDTARMQTCLAHANDVTATYGVTILSINVVAAVPADKKLMNSLAQGAVAAAEAQKFETVATGKAAAAKIEARGTAEAAVLRAQGDAEAERVRADGSKKAADAMSTSELAMKLALIDHTGKALGENAAFFFGADPKNVGNILTPQDGAKTTAARPASAGRQPGLFG